MKNNRHRVIKKRALTDHTFVLRLERQGLAFLPGQHINVGLPDDGQQREYSIYSSVQDAYLDILVQSIDSGYVSTRLNQLQSGDHVTVSGAHGRFTLPSHSIDTESFVFIATGTGISPFHCFAQSYPSLNYHILHGVRNLYERYDHTVYPKERYTACISQDPTGDFYGRVTDYLTTHPINASAHFYLCGNSDMIYQVFSILTRKGVARKHISTEVYF